MRPKARTTATFADLLNKPLDSFEDLDTAVWGELTERMTPREISSLEPSLATVAREAAFTLLRALEAGRGRLSPGEENVLLALIAAMLDPNKPVILKPTRPKSGRFKSLLATEGMYEKRRLIARELEEAVGANVKLEAAIADAMAKHGIGRSTAFSIWQSRNHYRADPSHPDVIEPFFLAPGEYPDPPPGEKLGWGERLIRYLSPTFPGPMD